MVLCSSWSRHVCLCPGVLAQAHYHTWVVECRLWLPRALKHTICVRLVPGPCLLLAVAPCCLACFVAALTVTGLHGSISCLALLVARAKLRLLHCWQHQWCCFHVLNTTASFGSLRQVGQAIRDRFGGYCVLDSALIECTPGCVVLLLQCAP
jgi:hypothetical protein